MTRIAGSGEAQVCLAHPRVVVGVGFPGDDELRLAQQHLDRFTKGPD